MEGKRFEPDYVLPVESIDYFSIWFVRRASTRKSNFSLFSLETCSPVVVGLNCFQLVRTYRKQVRDVSKSAALTAREPGLDTTEF